MSGPTRLPLRRLVTEPGPRMTRVAVRALRPLMRSLSHHDWAGLEHIPNGGAILAVNHVSNFDPLVMSHVVVEAGRWPYFLAKASLFSTPVLGAVVRAAQQIPVHRDSRSADEALTAARAAIAAGRLIIVYPEGTVTADPHGWPMTAKTGAARLALETGCPLIPAGQWGAQAILGMKKITAPRLIPRPTISVRVGAPVDLSDLRTALDRHRAARVATVRVMSQITALVAGIRKEQPPAQPFDYAAWRAAQRRSGGPRQGDVS